MTDYAILLHYLESRVVRELGIGITCGVCSSTLFARNNSTAEMFLKFEIFAKERCPYNILLERIRQIAIKREMKLQFKYMTQVVRLLLTLVFMNIDHGLGFNVLADSLYEFCIGHVTRIEEDILLYCPNIMLSSEDIYELRLKNTSVFPRIKDINATFQQVCVDDYFLAKHENSAAASDECYIFYKVITVLLITFEIDTSV